MKLRKILPFKRLTPRNGAETRAAAGAVERSL